MYTSPGLNRCLFCNVHKTGTIWYPNTLRSTQKPLKTNVIIKQTKLNFGTYIPRRSGKKNITFGTAVIIFHKFRVYSAIIIYKRNFAKNKTPNISVEECDRYKLTSSCTMQTSLQIYTHFTTIPIVDGNSQSSTAPIANFMPLLSTCLIFSNMPTIQYRAPPRAPQIPFVYFFCLYIFFNHHFYFPA